VLDARGERPLSGRPRQILRSKEDEVAGSISRLSGLCDAVRTMLRAPFLYLVRVNSLIRPNDTINGMALK
jgi:hypothetical protein